MDGYIDTVVTEKILSKWLGISLPSLQRLRSNGNGPRFVRLSERRIGYRRKDVELWLEARTCDRIDAGPAQNELERQQRQSGE
ncbi:DNA-binding protein [Mesorhizobium sp. C277A]|uniref:helix-turn-helix transcriptional regulator n=1 Tax=Mesorhizobium sp. C277A TaxID=2956827 RepID=UPI0018DE67D8|nr:DNA-binding protein [Mesorhizobium sp. LSJC277A00]